VARAVPAPLAMPFRPRSIDPVGVLLASAIALVLIFEGLLPFLNPGAWRRVFERVLQMSDAQIRLLGLSSLGAGVVVLLIFCP
jgi:uncharacterized protein YjeT (DUF2065 family)